MEYSKTRNGGSGNLRNIVGIEQKRVNIDIPEPMSNRLQ